VAKRGPKGPSKWTEERIELLGDNLWNTFNLDHTMMIMEDLCWECEIPLEYISRFKTNKKFSQTIGHIESGITSRLFKAGLTSECNPRIIERGLQNSGTKWRDKKELDHNIKGELKIVASQTDVDL